MLRPNLRLHRFHDLAEIIHVQQRKGQIPHEFCDHAQVRDGLVGGSVVGETGLET